MNQECGVCEGRGYSINPIGTSERPRWQVVICKACGGHGRLYYRKNVLSDWMRQRGLSENDVRVGIYVREIDD